MRATEGFRGGNRWSTGTTRRREPAATKEHLFDTIERRPKSEVMTPTQAPRRSSRVAIVSPTFIVFIQKTRYGPDAFWSLPGGRAELRDKNPIETAYREAWEEVRIAGLGRRHLLRLWEGVRRSSGSLESLALYWVSDELIKTAAKVGDENGDLLKVGIFRRDEVAALTPFNKNHRSLLATVLEYLETLGK